MRGQSKPGFSPPGLAHWDLKHYLLEVHSLVSAPMLSSYERNTNHQYTLGAIVHADYELEQRVRYSARLKQCLSQSWVGQ